jgi:hypothetical protein
LGCSKLEKETDPQDSNTQYARKSRAQSLCILLSVGLGEVFRLLSFFTLSSNIARAPKSSFPPESIKCGRCESRAPVLDAKTVVADTVGEYASSNRYGSTIANGGTWYEEPEPPPPEAANE